MFPIVLDNILHHLIKNKTTAFIQVNQIMEFQLSEELQLELLMEDSNENQRLAEQRLVEKKKADQRLIEKKKADQRLVEEKKADQQKNEFIRSEEEWLKIALEESAENARQAEQKQKQEQDQKQEHDQDEPPTKISITEPGMEPIAGFVFGDGSFVSHTSIFETIPSYDKTFTFGGLCFLIALFMENIQFFTSRNIVSPFALQEVLKKNRIGVNFESNSMLELDDIDKIALFLKVRIAVNSVNLGNMAKFMPSTSVQGTTGVKLNPVTLDLMGGMGGGHYIVTGLV